MIKTVGLMGGIVFVAAIAAFVGTVATRAEMQASDSVFEDFRTVESIWLYSDRIGSADATALERAKSAIAGPLGLSRSEAIYFIANTDNEGRPLRSQCTYRITGTAIPARWWSITLYDSETQHYVSNEINRASWNSEMLPRNPNGQWAMYVSSTNSGITWLPAPSESDRAFDLMLRVYGPNEQWRSAKGSIGLPIIERLAC